MKQIASILIFFSVLTLSSFTATRDIEAEKYQNFLFAIENQSTFSYFTVITVKNLNSGEVKEVCTTGNFVVGALHIELKADYDKAAENKVFKYLASRKNRYFELRNKRALENVSFFEASPRKLVAFEHQYDFNKVAAIIQNDKKFSIRLSDTEMKMFAHILFNRGYLTGESDCFGGTLEYVERTKI
jgi:hypothetical protein